jgi:hypothetical protein
MMNKIPSFLTIKNSLLRVFLFLMVFLGCLFGATGKSAAVYDGGNIIDNGIFLNAQSMSIAEIQNFLASRGSGLASRGFVLNCYGPDSKERQWYTAVGAPCDQMVPAADIIYFASQIYGINPRVVLATLQKEQSLITSPNPTDWQINQAMGYGCPTTGSCGTSNFFSQIDSGVWVLRYHYERARGNNTWWHNSTSWVCGTEKNFYKPNLYPYQDVRFYDEDGVHYRNHHIANPATSALYCYTPHAYNNPQGLYGRPPYGTVGRYYSGSYNFVYWYEIWFGTTQTGRAFKASNSNEIYIAIENYKLIVNQMAVLQDFGISPESIRTLSPEVVNSTPSPPPESGISTAINFLIKSPSDSDEDSSSVYIVSAGKRYQITTMEQFADFGLSEASIAYIPYSFIRTIPSGGFLSNFITTPTGAAFRVDNGQKQIIFEYPLYKSLNPSDHHSLVSYFFADLLPSGLPLVDKETLVKPANSDAVYLLANNTYYSVATYNAYRCWGFDSVLGMPVYRLGSNNHASAINPVATLSCLVNSGGTNYLLSRNVKYEVPASTGVSTGTVSSNLTGLINRIPSNSAPLTRYINDPVTYGVWYLDGGVRKVVPTYSNFVRLNIAPNQLTAIDSSATSAIPASGIKLGPGQAVKPDTGSSVFAISGDSRLLYATSDDFLAYGNSWADIETYAASALDAAYPYNSVSVNKYLYDQTATKVYLVDPNNCYLLSESLLTSYGKTQSAIAAAQTYSSSIFSKLNLAACKTGSTFVKSPGQSTVYWIDNGQKRLITRWDTLVAKSGTTNPYVVYLSASTLATLPTGTPLD